MTVEQALVGAMGCASWQARSRVREYVEAATGGVTIQVRRGALARGRPAGLGLNETGVTDAVMAALWRHGPRGAASAVTSTAEADHLGADIAILHRRTARLLLYQAKLAELDAAGGFRLKSAVPARHLNLLRRQKVTLQGETYRVTGRLALYQVDYTPFIDRCDPIECPQGLAGCTVATSSYPLQALTLNTGFKSGVAGFQSTATAAGARALCGARWRLTISKPGASSLTQLYDFQPFRCDNAISNKVPGCVVPWAAEVMRFSSTATPNIVTHINKAQASGLPGAVNVSTLIRITNTTQINLNRSRACSGRPTVSGKSCDEYPLATSAQGLANIPDWQNWRRSFSGCSWPALVNGQTQGSGVIAF